VGKFSNFPLTSLDAESMEQIPLDVEQWLIQDAQVAAKWKSLALHLGLADDVWEIEFRGSSRWRRKGWRDKEKLEMLLKFWKRRKPETYNIQTLKNILLIEGLSSMWMWINIITQQPRAPSPSPSPLWSRYLYSPQSRPSSSCSGTLWPEDLHSLSSGMSTTSRPGSQLSDHRAASCPPTTGRPDLIMMSSPRNWDWGRDTYNNSMDDGSDRWESLEIIEDGDNVEAKDCADVLHSFENCNSGENIKQWIKHQSPSCLKSSAKYKSCDKMAKRTDKDVIDRVNEMNKELTKQPTLKPERIKPLRRNVESAINIEKSCDEHFAFLLNMIQQSVADLKV